MRFFVEIASERDRYQIRIHQGSPTPDAPWRETLLGLQAEVQLQDSSLSLARLVGMKSSQRCEQLGEHHQYAIGQYLFAQTFGAFDNPIFQSSREIKAEIRIVTADPRIAQLPWMLLASRGVFLNALGWSVSAANTTQAANCELPASPKILVIMPRPSGMPETHAAQHFEKLEDLLSSADHRHTHGLHLRSVDTWEELERTLPEFQPNVIYYYGHSDSNNLVFAANRSHARVDKSIADLANLFPKPPVRQPFLIYLNAWQNEAEELLTTGLELERIAPALVINRTSTRIVTAQAQALAFWRSVVIEGDPPHQAIADLCSKVDDPQSSLVEQRWLTPILLAHYDQWHSHPPAPAPRFQRDPHWRLKLDRVRQFGQVFYQTSQMLQERKPRAYAYVWYGKAGQGVELFHKRLKMELQEKLTDVHLYEVQPEWPLELHQPNRSFEDMLTEAFAVRTLEHIPARIREQSGGVSGRRILVYVRHTPIQSSAVIKPGTLRTYLEWWDHQFAPLLEGQAFALLGISFVVGNPANFYKAMMEKARLGDLDLKHTVFQPLDEMERLVKKDLLDFLRTHNIDLPLSRKDRVLDKILEQSKGDYEMTLDALKDIADRAWDMTDEKQGHQGTEEYDYDYDDTASSNQATAGYEGAENFDVFLCHNNKDKPAVKKIAEQLQRQRLKPWLDEWQARPGVSWLRLLEDHIAKVKAAAVFIGSDGLGPWQQQEIDALLREFVRRQCAVIPVLLENAPAEPTLPLFLNNMTWVDFRKTDPDPMQQLLWGITGKHRTKLS
ncbi:MAG: toll/interleukin-1 receptor domain-containing protein [bacterium]